MNVTYGRGANLNLPIPRGSGDDIFLEALAVGHNRVRASGANVLIVAPSHGLI